jgi:hypothetical protein
LAFREKKDFAFMKSSDGWQKEKFYNLRKKSVVKTSYRTEGEGKYGPNHCSQTCKDHDHSHDDSDHNHDEQHRRNKKWMKKLIKAALIFLAAVFLYCLLIRQTPYCEIKENHTHDRDEEHHISHCDYHTKGFQIYQSCKPCPRNAFCHGHKMVSLSFLYRSAKF